MKDFLLCDGYIQHKNSTGISLFRQIALLIFFFLDTVQPQQTNWLLFYIYSVASMPSPSASQILQTGVSCRFFFINIHQNATSKHRYPLCGTLVWVLARSPKCALMVFEFCNSVRSNIRMKRDPVQKVSLSLSFWVCPIKLVMVWKFLSSCWSISVSRSSSCMISHHLERTVKTEHVMDKLYSLLLAVC